MRIVQEGDVVVSITSHSVDIPVDDPFDVVADPALPQAALALDPAEVELELQQLPRLVGKGGTVKLRSIRVIRHKPGRRFMLEYGVAVSTATGILELTLIGKVRASHKARTAYDLLNTLWNSGFDQSSSDGISVPEPIGVISRFNLWLQKKVPGLPLGELLPESAGTVLIQRVVKAIHKLHVANVPTKRHHTMEDELRILHERLPQLSQKRPEWSKRIDNLLAACTRLGAVLPPSRECGIHRDFYADQIIVDSDRLYLLDFDLYCMGDPALDIGNFAGHIIEQSLRQPDDASRLMSCEQALVDGFIELVGSASRQAVAVYTILTLVRHIHLSTLFPERHQWTSQLLELCEQRLHLQSCGKT